MSRNGLVFALSMLLLAGVAFAQPSELIALGSNRELFVDTHLVGSMNNTALRLHPPVTRETVLHYDKPWEGAFCGYNTIIHDGERYLLYYRGCPWRPPTVRNK